MPGPIVEAGDEVSLRTVEREDAAFLQRFYADPWARAVVRVDGHKSEAEVEEEFEDDANAVYLACADDPDAPYGHPDEDQTTPVGTVTARNLDGDRPWLAYWLLPEHQGEGYGGETVELAVDTLFRTCDVHGVSAGAYDFNEASRGLLESLGFVEEARRREARFVDGAYRDEIQYGVLREEWDS